MRFYHEHFGSLAQQICSSSWFNIWLWRLDFFVTCDLHPGLCAHVSEIRHKKLYKALCLVGSYCSSLLIVASRKHYTVDVVVARGILHRQEAARFEYSDLIKLLLLSLSTIDKDSKTKEENHKLLNGNSVDPADRRPRTQVNGKIQEDANGIHDTAMNGA
ncbi:Phosphatidylinositol:ceramide inositolphosphotransferase 1 [Hibiscus syriacus]|uniref:Phosphatidylinositol:ceramide inositolphosphotransferase 1 n=1 Tax=Hibiscus syriacus TaxID=106335 RepID=A0A6A2ZCS9_HIBSY|nr:Phosphatidylinositol:ceramide inositolphosphotransferase 1 [Hibiscus syriacus]